MTEAVAIVAELPPWLKLAAALVVLVVLYAMVDLWRRDRGGFWAGVGISTGITWFIATASGFSYTAWQPDLGPLPHGWGYLGGLALATVAFVGGVFHEQPGGERS